MTLTFINDLIWIYTFTYSIYLSLTFRTRSYTFIFLPIHMISIKTDTSFSQFIIFTVIRTRYVTTICQSIIHWTDRTGTTNTIDKIISRCTLTLISERIYLRTWSAIYTLSIFKSISFNTDTLSSKHVVYHVNWTFFNTYLSYWFIGLTRRTYITNSWNIVISLRTLTFCCHRIEILFCWASWVTFSLATW